MQHDLRLREDPLGHIKVSDPTVRSSGKSVFSSNSAVFESRSQLYLSFAEFHMEVADPSIFQDFSGLPSPFPAPGVQFHLGLLKELASNR